MTKTVAELLNVSKEFVQGGIVTSVLRDMSLQIPSGQMVMLVGPSGCGKTTLLSIVAGVLSPTKGQVILQGHDLSHMSDEDKTIFRRRHLGFIFQQYHLIPHLTVLENVMIPLLADSIPLKKAQQKAEKILSTLNMEDRAYFYPRQLSGGQQQRVAIGRALVHDPGLIICDEPTASLDAQTGQIVMSLLQGMVKNHHKSLLLVTHDERILPYADKVFTMDEGKIIPNHGAEAALPYKKEQI